MDGRRARTGSRTALYVGTTTKLKAIPCGSITTPAGNAAMRRMARSHWLLGDHLGSTAVTADANGSRVA
jgi:hypothetical protein